MSTKKESAAVAQNEKQENENVSIAPAIETSVTDLQKKLEEQLQELTRKKNLADRRQIFILKRDSLKNFLTDLEAEEITGNFESAQAKISFIFKTGSYREEEKFNIAIPELIVKHAKYLITDIDKAVVNIEVELLA
ncbi:MAG: hypothetical protein FWF54_00825 [Candidatus Azobacteroides sp.]|nr:hypothetical protein [Candidatus Azobacteroides sp.]